jgi:uncharacterized membrane protein
MNSNEINNRLKDFKIEEFIWIIYIGIIILSFISNDLEKKFFLFNDLISKNKYRKIMILIFTILIVVYFYFLKDAYDSLKELKPYDNENKKKLTYLSFIGSLLIFISGVIFLYIAYDDQDIDVELAFN